MLLLTGLSSSVFYALIWFVVPLLIANHTVSGMMEWALGIFDLAIVLMGFILGKIADRMNKKKLVFAGLLIFSVMGIILGFNLGFVFLLLGFIAAIGDELSSISLWLWLNALDENHDDDGLVSGSIELFHNLGWVIGPVVAGFLYPTIGAGWTIAIGGILIFSVWILYCFKLGKSHNNFELSYTSIEKKPHRFRHKQ
jgi:MFS family permease